MVAISLLGSVDHLRPASTLLSGSQGMVYDWVVFYQHHVNIYVCICTAKNVSTVDVWYINYWQISLANLSMVDLHKGSYRLMIYL